MHVVSVSQSLWNRAVSSDSGWVNPLHIVSGLNPFGTGQCLPTQTITLGENPIECLNPFGTGQCLPTPKDYRYRYSWKVSIPLEQGSVFRHYIRNEDNNRRLSQSLWNRAVSSDLYVQKQLAKINGVSIPLEQGSVFRLQWYFEALWHKAYESHFPTFSETQRVGS